MRGRVDYLVDRPPPIRIMVVGEDSINARERTRRLE